jgi:hypothetical protein
MQTAARPRHGNAPLGSLGCRGRATGSCPLPGMTGGIRRWSLWGMDLVEGHLSKCLWLPSYDVVDVVWCVGIIGRRGGGGGGGGARANSGACSGVVGFSVGGVGVAHPRPRRHRRRSRVAPACARCAAVPSAPSRWRERGDGHWHGGLRLRYIIMIADSAGVEIGVACWRICSRLINAPSTRLFRAAALL